MTFKGILKSMLVSVIEKVMDKSATFKECVKEAQTNLEHDNPFVGVDKPGQAHHREDVILPPPMDKDYGKLKSPFKKPMVN